MLLSTHIEKVLGKNPFTKKYFRGVFAADELLKINMSRLRKPAIIVVNTDIRSKPGMHWVAFYLPTPSCNAVAEYFDSMGETITTYNSQFEKFLSKYYVTYRHISRQLQSTFSELCGHYCCLYVFYRSKKHSMLRFKKMFSISKLLNNDIKVLKIYKRYLASKKSYK